MQVSISILSMNFNNFEEEIKRIDSTDCEFIHLDVMDGIFVPNTTFDEQLIKKINSQKIYDTHLMIVNPLKVIDKYNAISDYVTFHYEAESKENILAYLKNKKNNKIGISIKPSTDVSLIEELLPYLDLVLVMSVEPGFAGQKFIPSILPKIEYLSRMKKAKNYQYLIEVDGGINDETAKLCKEAGCEIVVSGSYVLKHSHYQERVDSIR